MQQDKTKLVTFDTEAHQQIAIGIETMQKAVGSTYGPGGRNVLVKKSYIHPVLTRDGVTVAREIAGHGNKLNDPIATEAAKLTYQASEKTNKTAGDGTTATVVLLGELYKAGRQQIAAGADAMILKRQLDADREKIVEYVQSKSVDCTKEKLTQVATISSGNEELGKMLSDLVHDVGAEGAITIEYQNAPHVEVEKVTGYLFGSGFKNLAATLEFEDPIIFVTEKRMASKADIIPILEVAAQEQKQFVIVGDVTGAAFDTLMWAIQNQKADGLCIPPPAYGNDGHEYFEDIATYTGARLYLESDSFKTVKLDDFGTVKKARISREKAILFGDSNRVVNSAQVLESRNTLDASLERIEDIKAEAEEPSPEPETPEEQQRLREVRKELKLRTDQATVAVKEAKDSLVKPLTIADTTAERIRLIKDRLDNEENPHVKEVLEQRLAKLAGKVSIVKVGAATDVERDELYFRVEDAVEACKSALSSGIVAGSATTLLFASDLPLEQFVKEALRKPFNLLMTNSAEEGGYRMRQILDAGYGYGFDLKNMTNEPVDLIEKGVVDATKVVLQTVKNAFSVAGAVLTMGATITEEEHETKND